MFAVVKNNGAIAHYLADPNIASIRPNHPHGYVYSGGQRGGLLSLLETTYYPHWKYKKTNYKRKGVKRTRKTSSKEQGLEIMSQLMGYVNDRAAVPTDDMAYAVAAFMEEKMEHSLVAVELPVLVELLGTERITQADLITSDAKDRLWMWEIKSGYKREKKQGDMLRLQKVANKRYEQWELQRYYTHLGLEQHGLKIHKSVVLHVYKEGKNIAIKKRPVPKWCNEQLK